MRTLGLSGRAKAMEILGKKGRDTVPIKPEQLQCCNQKVNTCEVWFLKDIKGFTARKLLKGICPNCGDDVALQIMTSTDNGKTYYNLYNGIEAVKTIYREKKRIIKVLPNIQTCNLYGWIYGINVEIKNKKSETTQIRQYAADSNGKRKLVKKIYT